MTDDMRGRFVLFGRAWNYGYEPFQTAGNDTFIAVSPTRNAIHTCDPAVSAQIFRRAEFRKPLGLIGLLNVFGPGLTGSEGAEGRLYRRITAPFFTDRTMDQVWSTSMESVQALMQNVVNLQNSTIEPKSKKDLRSMIANMTLYSVFTVCFAKTPDKERFRLNESIPTGHTIGFRHAVTSTLDCITQIALMPAIVLSIHLPIRKSVALLKSTRAFTTLNPSNGVSPFL